MKRNILEMSEREYRLYRESCRAKIRKANFLKIAFLLTLFLICLTVLLTRFTAKANVKNNIVESKYYTYTNLAYDQSVSDLAVEYYNSDEYCNKNHYADAEDYLKEIKQINHISSDTVINGGKLIYLPYYVAETVDSEEFN